jgi:CrcB protein
VSRARIPLYASLALAGAAGGTLRYAIAAGAAAGGFDGWPWATLAVNGLGCLVIGLYWRRFGAGSERPASAGRQAVVMTGFCGGLTTMSMFGVETWSLVAGGEFAAAAVYVTATLLTSLGAVAIGAARG